MPDHPWCPGCPVCDRASGKLHLYIDDSNSHEVNGTLYLGAFATRQVERWGLRSVGARVNLAMARDRVFHFTDMTRQPDDKLATLGNSILDALAAAPLTFFARGMAAPFTDRDQEKFSTPTERLRFYMTEFLLVITARAPTEINLIIAKGPQSDDTSYLTRLQQNLDEATARRGLPGIHVAEQTTRKCQLLQLADLIVGCTRQLHSAGSNPNKLQIALDLRTRLGLTNGRFTMRTWDWFRHREEQKA